MLLFFMATHNRCRVCVMSFVMDPDTEEDSMDIYDGLDIDLSSNRGIHICYVFLYLSARRKKIMFKKKNLKYIHTQTHIVCIMCLYSLVQH